MTKWDKGGEQHVLKAYERLHEGKLGAHWIWIALERIANGEPELEVMRDYGYVYSANTTDDEAARSLLE